MSIVKTDAFVLKSFRYGETSKIAALFTKDFGKMNVIIKGARNYKSKLCGVIEGMNYISTVIYKKENRELQLLFGAQFNKTFSGITEDFDELRTAFGIIECLNKSLPDGEKNHEAFELLLSVFERLNEAGKNYINLNLYFLVNLLSLLGLSPEFKNLKTDKTEFETFFTDSEFYLSNDKLEILKAIKLSSVSEAVEIEADINNLNILKEKFEKYLSMHTHGGRFYKSSMMFKQLEKYV